MRTVTERISTVEDGPNTVNERLSPGGPGPEGQLDTAHEILSGAEPAPRAEPVEVPHPSALKAEWVDYAVTQGVERGDAEASTKAELVEKFS